MDLEFDIDAALVVANDGIEERRKGAKRVKTEQKEEMKRHKPVKKEEIVDGKKKQEVRTVRKVKTEGVEEADAKKIKKEPEEECNLKVTVNKGEKEGEEAVGKKEKGKIPVKQEEERKDVKIYGKKVFKSLEEYEEEEKMRRRRETRIPICTTRKEREEMGITPKEEKKEVPESSVCDDSAEHSYQGSWEQLSRQTMTVLRHSNDCRE